MGKYGFHVIDADGHGGERSDWMDQVPEQLRPLVARYRERIRAHYGRLPIPGGGLARRGDKFQERPGMSDPAARAADMDLEGIDVTVTFPRGSGEEWALEDRHFAIALCRAINDAKAAFNRNDPARFKGVAKLPLIDPHAAVSELRRAVTELGLVGAVVPQHVRDKNLNDPSFDPVWAEAERLGVPVCVHGGGQAVDQVPVAIDRFATRLEVHAITHPVGNMIALDCFIVGGVLHRFPKLRVAFLESGCGWLPFWLERLDEHWEKMPDQAPAIDRKPSEYFQDGRCFISCDPDERMIPDVARLCGDDKVVYASDYYHWDCAFPDSVRLIAERTDLGERTKKKILGDNAARLFNL